MVGDASLPHNFGGSIVNSVAVEVSHKNKSNGHLPNVRCAGSHLTELRGKYPGKMDTEILEISIKSHGDLTTEISLPKTNGTGSRFEPKESMLVFQAIVNDPDANAGDLARRCFPDTNKTRNSVYEHMRKVRSRFPGHSDAEILTYMIKNYGSGEFTAEVLFTVTAQSKWTAREVQILLKATCNEQSREYIRKNYLSHRSKTSIDDVFGNLHKKFPAKSAKQLLDGMIEEQGGLTLGLEGIDIFRPEGELPPKRGNKLGFGPQGFRGESKSGVGGNDKKKVKKVKTFNDHQEDGDVENERNNKADLEEGVGENNRKQVISTGGEDNKDEEEDEPPAKRRRTQSQRSKKR